MPGPRLDSAFAVICFYKNVYYSPDGIELIDSIWSNLIYYVYFPIIYFPLILYYLFSKIVFNYFLFF
jgi:hypothetical protein